jgi:hypothetical protein
MEREIVIPAKAGTQTNNHRDPAATWIPASAGMTN